jgi:hypothetical protein
MDRVCWSCEVAWRSTEPCWCCGEPGVSGVWPTLYRLVSSRGWTPLGSHADVVAGI